MSDESQINNYSHTFKENKGLIIKKNNYKISEKLGEFHRRKADTCEYLKHIFPYWNLNSDDDRGYSLNYKEDNNVAFSILMSKEDTTKTRVLSQNLYFPQYIFEGNAAYSNKVIGEGKIYYKNNVVYKGQINYNLFPQEIREDNNNDLIIKVEQKRFKLSEELPEESLIRLDTRRIGPFKGQITKPTHPHHLTKCITPYRIGWKCNHCYKSFNKNIFSYYCTRCDFDFCGDNCENPDKRFKERKPYFYSEFQFKSLKHKHPLTCMKLVDRQSILKCFSCLNNLSNQENIFYCTICDFRLCQKCKINEERGEPWQFHTCWHEHPLTLCRTKGKKNFE